MKFIYKKAIAVFVAFCLVFVMAAPASEAKAATAKKVYVDVAGSSYATALNYAIDNGLMSNSGNKIFPDNKLTKGAACLSLNALLGATETYANMDKIGNLKKGDQYYNTVSVGLNAGYLQTTKNGTAVYSPKAYATYGYLRDIFTSVLGVDMTDVIVGSNDPAATLTRGEFAAILMKLAPNIVTNNTSKVVSGDVYITKPNVVLSNVKVDGNLIITDAVGDQNVTLRSVEVTGKLVIRGGGENSIFAIGNTIIPSVVVQQFNHPVSFKVVGNAKVDNVEIKGGNGVNIQGKVEKLEITANLVKVSLDNATIETVNVTGAGSSLNVTEKTTVKNVVVAESAVGTKLEVSGSVEGVAVSAKDSAVNVVAKGKVKAVKAEKSASNFAVAVEKEATIDKVESTAANTVVDGEGTVVTAVVTGEGSDVKTEGTSNVEPTPAPTTTPSDSTGDGGGGGGGGNDTTDNTATYRAELDRILVNTLTTLTKNYGSVNTSSISVGTVSVTLDNNNKDLRVNEVSGTNVIQAVTAILDNSRITNISYNFNGSTGSIQSSAGLLSLVSQIGTHGTAKLVELSPLSVTITYRGVTKTYSLTIQE